MTDPLAHFRAFLASRGLTTTPQRRTILEAFFADPDPVSCEELLERARKEDPALGLSTVYRTVRLLVQAGLAFGVHHGDGVFLHVPTCRSSGGLRLRCARCGSTFPLPCEPLTQSLRCLCEDGGCTLIGHHGIVVGLCPECAAAQPHQPEESEPATSSFSR
ncbi:MAG: Fur family transcriptional regulator [Desulfovibrionaceae bacterium]